MSMKKQITLSLLMLFLMLSASCAGSFEKSAPTYFMTMEDHTQGYVYPSGIYYFYAGPTPEEHAQPLAMFNALQADNITVREGWYRPYLTGCSGPGSNRTTTAIYANVIIVRLDESNDNILKHKFRALGSPKPIACGYEVRHYMLHR